MKSVRWCSAVTAALLLFAMCATAQEPAANYPKATILGSEVRTMKSASTGRDYDIYIHLPSTYGKDKDKKYPALYILDGQWDFKLADSVVGGLVYDKFTPEIILIGIVYSGENPDFNALRAMDYTAIASDRWKGSGDGPKFLKFLKTELIPFMESNYRCDAAHRILQGSSLAGWFTLYTMFTDTKLFSAYISASPDVTSADRAAFKMEAEYAKTNKELPAKLFLAVGGREDLTVPVQEFMQVLKSRKYKGLKLETRTIEGEGHASNKPELYNRGLKWVFGDWTHETE